MIELLVATVYGLLTHQLRRWTRRLPHGWQELTNYAVGVVSTLPIIGLFYWRLSDVKNDSKRGFISYVLAFVGTGAGVALGWLIDAFWPGESEL